MTFKRINDTTVNCIITPEDLNANGIKLEDLFERKEEAVKFIRGIIAHAARSENLDLSSESVSMRITVLPDQSVSLTISEDPVAAEEMQKALKDLQSLSEKALQEDAGQEQKQKEISPDKVRYLFRFFSMHNVIACGKFLSAGSEMKTDLLKDEEFGDYYLLVGKTEESGPDFERRVLSSNEFGTLITSNESYISFIREHTKCIIENNAVELLAQL